MAFFISMTLGQRTKNSLKFGRSGNFKLRCTTAYARDVVSKGQQEMVNDGGIFNPKEDV